MSQQSLFGGNPKKAKKARKSRAKTTGPATKIKVSGYTRKRGRLPGRAKNGRFKRG